MLKKLLVRSQSPGGHRQYVERSYFRSVPCLLASCWLSRYSWVDENVFHFFPPGNCFRKDRSAIIKHLKMAKHKERIFVHHAQPKTKLKRDLSRLGLPKVGERKCDKLNTSWNFSLEVITGIFWQSTGQSKPLSCNWYQSWWAVVLHFKVPGGRIGSTLGSSTPQQCFGEFWTPDSWGDILEAYIFISIISAGSDQHRTKLV